MAFQRSAGAISNDGETVLIAQTNRGSDFFRGMRKYHRIGQHRIVRRFVAAMVLAHRHRGRQTIDENGLQFGQQCLRQFASEGRRWGRMVHGSFSVSNLLYPLADNRTVTNQQKPEVLRRKQAFSRILRPDTFIFIQYGQPTFQNRHPHRG